jgi:Plasmid pRiA4b ORF-3-like protein
LGRRPDQHLHPLGRGRDDRAEASADQSLNAYVFEAELLEEPAVSRRLLVRGDQTLAAVHDLLRQAFEWWEDDEYSFQLDADVQLQRLELAAGQEIDYVFGSGDEWRVRLRLDEIQPAGDEKAVVLEVRGKAPPQYPIPDEEELGAGD